jgi:hypothetical protein
VGADGIEPPTGRDVNLKWPRRDGAKWLQASFAPRRLRRVSLPGTPQFGVHAAVVRDDAPDMTRLESRSVAQLAATTPRRGARLDSAPACASVRWHFRSGAHVRLRPRRRPRRYREPGSLRTPPSASRGSTDSRAELQVPMVQPGTGGYAGRRHCSRVPRYGFLSPT